MSLFRHNLKVALRNLLKYKLQTAVSIVSLSLGMVFFSQTALWLRYERSYDAFHRDADDIYLLNRKDNSEKDYVPFVSFSMGASVAERNPQIESFARSTPDVEYPVLDENDNSLETVRGMAIDDNYQNFFDVNVVEGDSRLNLQNNEIAITKECADRLFAGQAIGKPLRTKYGDFSIKAIIESPRQPSIFRYDFLMTFGELEKTSYSTMTFFKVSPWDFKVLSQALASDTIFTSLFDKSVTATEPYMVETENYLLVPLKQVRDLNAWSLGKVQVKREHLNLFMILSAVLIIIALVNYFTMLVIHLGIRSREISLRYATGAHSFQIISLFSVEILILLALSVALGVLVCEFGLPFFIRISGIVKSHGALLMSFLFYSVTVGAVSLLVASALITIVAKRQLVNSLGKYRGKSKSAEYRVSLCFQIAVCLCTIFCSIVITAQIKFLTSSTEMGFCKTDVGILEQYGMNESEVDAALGLFRTIPEFEQTIYGFRYPTTHYQSSSSIQKIREEDNEAYDNVSIEKIYANRNYLDFLDVRFLAGETFRPESDSLDQNALIVINETAAKALGYTPTEIIGERFIQDNIVCTVIGVIRDLCYLDPATEISPLVYVYSKDGQRRGFNSVNTFLFRYHSGSDWTEIEKKAKDVVESIHPGVFHTIRNPEEEYKEYLSSEYMLNRFLSVVSIICIVIATCGIFSMVSLACERRKKEIAIRKINGAKARNIVGMFLGEHIAILILSALFAFPAGYLLMHRWLSVYVKQVPITIWMFLGIFAGMACIMALTILRRIKVASSQDPALVVKSE